jgi:hypothetical protein
MHQGGRMQRHFSNRGEALAEVAAAKMMAHRMPAGKSNQRKSNFTPEQWKTPVLELIPVTDRKRTKEPKQEGKSSLGPPGF